MDRFIILIMICLVTSQLSGCGQEKNASTPPFDPPSKSTPSEKPLPPEYRTLAKVLCLRMETSADESSNKFNDTEWLSEINSALSDFKNMDSQDDDIEYISNEGAKVLSDMLSNYEELNKIPKADTSWDSVFTIVNEMLMLKTDSLHKRVLDIENIQANILSSLQTFVLNHQKATAMQLMLPKVANKYSASFCDSTGRISLDFDESWGSQGPYDWLKIFNSGAPIKDCTIVVELTSENGEKQRNVHYLEELPSKTWMYARYEDGLKIDLIEKQINRTTVENVSNIELTLYSPKYATQITYKYKAEEFEKDVAKYCKSLNFKGSYQPFVDGIIWDTERGAKIKLEGMEFIPDCVVSITFRNDKESKVFSWPQKKWSKGEERTFSTKQGELTYEPSSMDMVITFPDTIYTHKAWFKVSHGR